MDKNAIKKYAVWARTELITRVSQRAEKYDITAEADANASSVNGVLLSDAEKKQRKALIEQVQQKGFDQVMEEVAYTRFNRFIALRFMEVNGYLPSHIRVFTDDNNNFKPQILAEAIHLELDGLDMEKVYEMKNNNENEELYKYLIIAQCNYFSHLLPKMFQTISDYTELLFPENILREGSVIEQMITLIPEDDWKDQIQIIGWLYQYYITEQNEMVYDGRFSKDKIKKELVPAATTIYTPDWPVRYMVDNSLGRLWIDNSSSTEFEKKLKFYIKRQENGGVKGQSSLNPENIRCIDPCCGSGHVLTYMFDVLVEIYADYGVSSRDAVKSIVEKNIWGLDIDDRAAQMAYFSVMMKAVQYDRRFLRRTDEDGKIPQPNIFAIKESNYIDNFAIEYFVGNNSELRDNIDILLDTMKDAKEYGSALVIPTINFELLKSRYLEVSNEINMYKDIIDRQIYPLICGAFALSQKYDVVVTNPPYLGSTRFDAKLGDFVKEKYSDVKSDLSMVIYEKALNDFLKFNGYAAFITTASWMYLSSFETLRKNVFENYCVDSLVDFGTELFDGKVGHNPIVAWVTCKRATEGEFPCVRLVDYCYSKRDQKETEFFNVKNYYYANQQNFLSIPGSPTAYWISKKLVDSFKNGISVDAISDFTGSQNITADNNTYLRTFWEVDFNEIGEGRHWAYYAKGGEYRKWYGNIQLLVDTSNEAINHYKTCKTANYLNEKYWFQEGITYSAVTSKGTGFRYYEPVGAFDKGGATICYLSDNLYYVLGLLNTKIAEMVFKLMNPTINLQVKDVKALPIIFDESKRSIINELVKENIRLSKEDWDSMETSYGFKKNPLIQDTYKIEDAFGNWEKSCSERFAKLKANEEELNRLFIEIYELQADLNPDVDDQEVTVRLADRNRDIKEFISYAVGCMFGRFSLDSEGFVCTSGDIIPEKYGKYEPDKDDIIPVCDDEYFDDDIVTRFVDFVESVYGKEYLEENLKFIAESLNGSGTAREKIRNYFVNDFYSDHCSTYSVVNAGKKPIYWMFDSGKKNGFKCLSYMSRYKPDLLARIRTDYVHEMQSRYRSKIDEIERILNNVTTSEKVKLNKKLSSVKEQAEEIRVYEEYIHHLADQMIEIDLNKGIKNNYSLFADVLAKIK